MQSRRPVLFPWHSIEMLLPGHGAHEVLKAMCSLVCGRQAAACHHVLPAGSRQTGSVQQLLEDIDPDLDLMPGQVRAQSSHSLAGRMLGILP